MCLFYFDLNSMLHNTGTYTADLQIQKHEHNLLKTN